MSAATRVVPRSSKLVIQLRSASNYRMRHPLPFVAAAVTTWFACLAAGVGLSVWLGLVWTAPVGAVLGVVLVMFGTIQYRQAAPTTQTHVYRLLWTLFLVAHGFVWGGIPGALVGRSLGDDFGEMLGYFATAAIGAIAAGVCGWRWSRGLT